MELFACLSRREVADGNRLFVCDHPRVHAAGGLVAVGVCQSCDCRRAPADASERIGRDARGNDFPTAVHPRKDARRAESMEKRVTDWCEAVDLPYYVHVPSLVQHIGDTSTIWPAASATGRRRAGDFLESVAGGVVETPRAQRGAHHGS